MKISPVPALVALIVLIAPAAQATVTSPTGVPSTLAEGATFSGSVATFSSATPTAASFTASINWGDGVTSTGVVTGSGSYSVSGNHIYADEGTFTVTTTITDNTDSSTGIASATFTITEGDVLTPNPVAIVGVEGAVFSGTVATFSDTYTNNVASDFTATIAWGDGVTDTGVVSVIAGTITVTGTHTYADEGVYSVHVTLSDDAPGTATATAISSATIADATLAASGTNVTQAGLALVSTQVASFTDANTASSTPGDFTAQINWGDGTTTPGTISGASGSFTVSGTHTYAFAGVYTVKTAINDVGGSKANATATAAVGGAAIPALSPLLLVLLAITLGGVVMMRRT